MRDALHASVVNPATTTITIAVPKTLHSKRGPKAVEMVTEIKIPGLHRIHSIEKAPLVVKKGQPWELNYVLHCCFLKDVKLYKTTCLRGQGRELD